MTDHEHEWQPLSTEYRKGVHNIIIRVVCLKDKCNTWRDLLVTHILKKGQTSG